MNCFAVGLAFHFTYERPTFLLGMVGKLRLQLSHGFVA